MLIVTLGPNMDIEKVNLFKPKDWFSILCFGQEPEQYVHGGRKPPKLHSSLSTKNNDHGREMEKNKRK